MAVFAELDSFVRKWTLYRCQGFGGQVPGWRQAALMIVPPFSGPAVDPIRPYLVGTDTEAKGQSVPSLGILTRL